MSLSEASRRSLRLLPSYSCFGFRPREQPQGAPRPHLHPHPDHRLHLDRPRRPLTTRRTHGGNLSENASDSGREDV